MKVLVLNGSPKRDASDTMHITRAFLEGMGEGAQIEAEIIHVIDRHIEFCRGCFACKRNGGRCAQHLVESRRVGASADLGEPCGEAHPGGQYLFGDDPCGDQPQRQAG